MSKTDTVAKEPVGKLQGNFTQVPNSILRTAGLFKDPFDFMIYLLLYSYSYGFGRDTADMGQAQIEAFAGVSKNRVKRALERLIAQEWIKLVSEYEHARVSRRWKVISPEKHASSTVSKTDTVQNGQCPIQTVGVSTVDTLTVSKMDTYKESIQTQIQRNSLSGMSDPLRIYFSELKPQRKKESEHSAFEEIKKDFSIVEITKCFDYLKSKGLPGGGSCHSPMAYLATALQDILAIVQTEESLEKTRAEIKERREVEERAKAEAAAREEREWEIKERAFNKTFSSEERQREMIHEICRNKHFPLRGAAARAFAINAWFSELTVYERQEMTV